MTKNRPITMKSTFPPTVFFGYISNTFQVTALTMHSTNPRETKSKKASRDYKKIVNKHSGGYSIFHELASWLPEPCYQSPRVRSGIPKSSSFSR